MSDSWAEMLAECILPQGRRFQVDKDREELNRLLYADDVVSMHLLSIEFDSELLFAAACLTWLYSVTHLKYIIDPILFSH